MLTGITVSSIADTISANVIQILQSHSVPFREVEAVVDGSTFKGLAAVLPDADRLFAAHLQLVFANRQLRTLRQQVDIHVNVRHAMRPWQCGMLFTTVLR